MESIRSNSTLTTQRRQVKLSDPGSLPQGSLRPLPSCFSDHHAPRSVAVLFDSWVRQADAMDNGIIPINRQKQSYSDTTADRAIVWLTRHRLMSKIEQGGGRGNGARYFIRWSFSHPALSARQKGVNHAGYAKTVNRTPHSRIKGVLEERLYSFSHEKTCVLSTKKRPDTRAFRWSMSEIRGEVEDSYFANDHDRQKLLIAAIGASLWRKLQSSEIRPGPDLGEVVCSLISRLRGAWTIGQDRRSWYAWGGLVVRSTLEDLRIERLSAVASARLIDRIRQEKAEAQGGLDQFLTGAGVSSIREYNAKRKRLIPRAGEE